MRSKKGFTLVELLVVMAIIAILASIVVPNVQRYIVRARLTRSVAEVSGMELSLTAILTDAGKQNLSQLFQKTFAPEFTGWPTDILVLRSMDPLTGAELFENAATIYSQITYDLLRMGRDCMRDDSGSILSGANRGRIVDQDLMAKLGPNYMDIGLDAWGQPYRVWPGPWRYSTDLAADAGITRWPIPFRLFSVDTVSTSGGASFAVQKDPFVLVNDSETSPSLFDFPAILDDVQTWPSQVNFPAQANKSVFIWSYGQNTRNSQMIYQGQYSMADPSTWFYQEMGEDIGGGDDVNNWDSGNSWQRFYM